MTLPITPFAAPASDSLDSAVPMLRSDLIQSEATKLLTAWSAVPPPRADALWAALRPLVQDLADVQRQAVSRPARPLPAVSAQHALDLCALIIRDLAKAVEGPMLEGKARSDQMVHPDQRALAESALGVIDRMRDAVSAAVQDGSVAAPSAVFSDGSVVTPSGVEMSSASTTHGRQP
ncbi:hypothetical protein [Devriesea agamarum]|uniref:hypothetical protein n=1 Tax=Devriesea agamarum TaxID=472569 RepID=UPI00071C5C82|nr:hypothetical protein [Devriesea agamarum]